MLAADLKVVVKSEVEQVPAGKILAVEPTDVTFLIPRNQPNLDNVLLLADRLVVPKAVEKDGEKRIPITEKEPEFALQQMTGVPWEQVQHSPYAMQVVEPAIKPGDRKTRAQQEYGVGYVLKGKGAHGKVKEWLQHQEAVEGDTKEPRTVLPVEWVSRVGLENMRSADSDMKAALPKVFKRS
ncbi:MAG: hypothetical protein K2Q01_00445 [Rickettsiales bacterium]|nr:hypothetical protein [Rickettsiales bacterium]